LENEVIYFELPPKTYVREHKVYYTKQPYPSGKSPFRVIMDPDSIDLQKLTEVEFSALKVDYVSANFMNIPALLNEGKVDAAIWDIDEANNKLSDDINARPLSDHTLEFIGDLPYTATLVGKKNRKALKAVIENCLHRTTLLRIQTEVMEKSRLPEY
jgi:hypothetical protein